MQEKIKETERGLETEGEKTASICDGYDFMHFNPSA
jgi:hypothetical protein